MKIDGVEYTIDWGSFTVGSSFFIPCLRDADGIERIRRKMDRLGYKVLIKVVIEDGIRGLRVWRVSRYNQTVGSLQ